MTIGSIVAIYFLFFVATAFATLSVSSAHALDQSSLRLAKQSPTSVVLSWSDPDPTVFCIVRDPSGVPTSLVASVSGLSYVDAAPSVPLLYYSVDEPTSGLDVDSRRQVWDSAWL